MSGWVERTFWTMAVASASGGVQISSTTISIPLALRSFSRSGLKKKTVAAVLSPTIAPFLSAQDALGAAERLDPALGVDLRDGHLRAHLLELALARPPAGERRHQRDLEVVGRGRDGRGEQHRGRDEHGQQDREWLHRSSPHV